MGIVFWRGRTWRCRGANDERELGPRSLGTVERPSKVAAEQFVCSGEGRRGREGTDDVGRWDGSIGMVIHGGYGDVWWVGWEKVNVT